MNTFVGLILYVAIGGVFFVNANNGYIEDCEKHMSTSSASFIVFAWPAAFPLALLGDSPEEVDVCGDY